MSTPRESPYRSAPLRIDESSDPATCLEVVARWGDEVLAVAHLAPGERFVMVPSSTHLARDAHRLVHPDVIAPWTFAEHTPDGRCVAADHPEPIVAGVTVRRREGSVALTARRVPMMATPRREPVDRGARRVLTLTASLLVVLAVAVAFGSVPPARRGAGADRPARSAEGMRLLRALSRRWPEAAAPPARSGPEVAAPPARGFPDVSDPWRLGLCGCCHGPCQDHRWQDDVLDRQPAPGPQRPEVHRSRDLPRYLACAHESSLDWAASPALLRQLRRLAIPGFGGLRIWWRMRVSAAGRITARAFAPGPAIDDLLGAIRRLRPPRRFYGGRFVCFAGAPAPDLMGVAASRD